MDRFEEFFWQRVPQQSAGCWEWSGYIDRGGYGIHNRFTPPRRAHRYSWELHHGAIPDGLFVLHKCDNRRCVRPDHLWLGTAKDNVQDMCQKGRSLKGRTIWSEEDRQRMSRQRRGQKRQPLSVEHRANISRAKQGMKYNVRVKRTLYPRGEAVGSSRLTAVQVQEIRELLNTGMSQTKIARLYGVAQTTISAIKRGKNWAKC